MGGSDSKEEKEEEQPVVINKNKQKSPRLADSKIQGDKNSIHNQQNNHYGQKSLANSIAKSGNHKENLANTMKQSIANPSKLIDTYNRSGEEAPEQLYSNPDNLLESQNNQGEPQAQFFEDWLPKFHQQGSISLKIMIIELKPAMEFKKLQRLNSEHTGTLTWNYQTIRTQGQTQLALRFIFEEDGEFIVNFLVDQQSETIEGDQGLWNLVCPFRTNEEISKVGSYNCERTYQSSEQQENSQNQGLDPDIFQKWGQKPPQNRAVMKQLLERRRIISNLKQNLGFDYRQTSKYFTQKNEWVFSLLLQQKHNCFKCWMIQSAETDQSANSMRSTLRNDIQNRQSMYVQEMKNKKSIYQQMSKSNLNQ